MQIFEFHFNPKKDDLAFDSFVYEPENIYEKRLGSLYLIGEIKNATPQSSNFLNKLAKKIQKSYYKLASKSPEKALSESLKKANSFLSEEVKNDNVGWLGNLNLAVLSIKKQKLNFTQTGDIKILLIRQKQITDISKKLEFQEIEPYPLKIFSNTISGKLTQKDLLLVLTKKVFEFFKEKSIIQKIAELEEFNQKEIKRTIPSNLFNKGEGSKISGICFLILLKEKIFSESKKQIFASQKKVSFSKIFQPIIKPLVKVKETSLSKIKKITPSLKRKKETKKTKKSERKRNKEKGKLQENIITILVQFRKFIRAFKIKRNIILIVFLASILLLGFLMFKGAQQSKEIEVKNTLKEIEKKVSKAENFLVFKEENQAKPLLKEAWEEIIPLTEKETGLKSEIITLKESIEKKLKDLNNFNEIGNPEIADLSPDLFSSPSSSQVNPPQFDFNFDSSVSYLSNLYFLDKKTCEIVKYKGLGNNNWGPPVKWIKDKGPCSNPKSMAIDGSIWLLNGDNSLLRYHQGSFEEKIEFDFFPYSENITQIETKKELPYLLLLEPIKKRVIITDKKGKIVKQFYSEKFDELKDFEISDNGKIIYLLNGSKVYQIKIE